MSKGNEIMKELPSDRPLVLWRQEGRWCAGHVDEGGALVEQGAGATPEKAEEGAIRNAVEAEGFTLRCRERVSRSRKDFIEMEKRALDIFDSVQPMTAAEFDERVWRIGATCCPDVMEELLKPATVLP